MGESPFFIFETRVESVIDTRKTAHNPCKTIEKVTGLRMNALDRVKPIIEKKVASLGCELFDVKFIRAGSHSILRVYIYKEGGVSISDCERVSHELSVLLDVEDFSTHPYSLEISSPGIDRPLITEKDFKFARGNKVAIRIKGTGDKYETITGALTDCANATVTLAVGEETKTIALSEIISGKIEVSFK